ncbi:MAG: PSD1 domain-containing protein [Planctomyces sp.]|nr:PSD1 domain-containing protein [Planctomyces sp.]
MSVPVLPSTALLRTALLRTAFGGIVCLLVAVSSEGHLVAEELDANSIEFFESKVRPLLIAHCYECHSEDAVKADNLQGGLRLDHRQGVQQGGDTGPVVVPGKPDESMLIKSVRYTDKALQMPPKQPLSADQVAILEAWVAMGAPDPREGTSAPTAKRGIDIEAGRQLWAFQSPVKHTVPEVLNINWPKQPLDHFVLSALEQRSLKPVRSATRQELIRRATFDLIGLPPTPEDVAAFENDFEPGAWDRVIERLLASPHYGERWGRYWLDVARYADDQGNSFLTPTPAAYLYRDWVVKAFNEDMPYDEFIRLQIAGDEVSGPADNYVTRLAGLGFQSLGPQFRKGAAGEAKAKADELEDRVDTLSRGILGLTVSCARCHDHKFDPIPTRDYYSLAAAYNGAEWPTRMLASPETIESHKQWTAKVEQQTASLKKFKDDQTRQAGRLAMEKADAYAIAACKMVVMRNQKITFDDAEFARQENLQLVFLNRWARVLAESSEEPIFRSLRDAAKLASDSADGEATTAIIPPAETLKAAVIAALNALKASETPGADPARQPTPVPPEHERLLTVLWKDPNGPFFVPENELAQVLTESERQQFEMLQADLNTLTKNPVPSGPMMPSIHGGGQPMQVFVRGNPLNPGEPAPPGFLRVLTSPETAAEGTTFSRLELANAIVSPQNPLTARVFVNRVWHYHFGRGIVSTLSNFGKLGSPPTHPELLDTLSVQFVESGWSMKWLHREIMRSATYQLSSDPHAENITIDPGNEYLWRMTPRRLDIEALRDALLSVSGRLDPQIGGPSIDQTTPGVKEVEGFNFFSRLNGFEADNPEGRRRTLYTVVSRYAPNATLTLFDFPEPNVTSDQRIATTVPQQQLFVLNSPFMFEMSRAFAKRLESSASQDEDRLRLAWQLAYARQPTDEELAIAVEFLGAPAETSTADQLNRWEQLCHALLAGNEFMFLP